MILYLVRHGEAVDVGEKDVEQDADRMLSSEGRKKTKAVAKGLRLVGCQPERIVTSPLIRAKQTAEIMAHALASKVDVEEAQELAVGSHAAKVVTWLRGQADVPTLLVGHMPDMGAVASVLVCGNAEASFTFKKAAVCCVSFEGAIQEGKGRLEWLLQPGQLRKLGRTIGVGKEI